MADTDSNVSVGKSRSSMDLATIVGLLAGFGLIGFAIYMGGSPASFVNIPSVLIVVGGTIAVTMMCFSLSEFLRSFKVFAKTLSYSARDPAEAAVQVLKIAELARRQGVLSLQGVLEQMQSEPLLYKGMAMVVDGTPGEEVEAILKRDLMATAQRHRQSANILRKAAEFSPAMGLIGTLIGLVQMLGNLADPSTIGPSMAVALLTTFYGAVLANMVFSPMASKLDRNSSEEGLVNSIYVMGAASVGRQENPRRLEMMLNSILPPANRVQYFD
ncbi:motility protein A [Varunaivibrio sulfuroxidans]|uniref:Chemotaxis protein MotA n=1 Tax=Varunaivibrio sulfuroxidans TaxID=1773489 RepID=A0A4R3JCS3_9PROT|nr:MotA/TolQ/ExbB proton channel family protein [Varunaivibrio sulfuroxidans]TCS63467.1 chemotaxis protein MotA [Varunaivibrio sulfuroxidans]WES30387.1 MotA/TolQ/ExbB proton channel family protein [Varunaivibrio sulfuroxidans]